MYIHIAHHDCITLLQFAVIITAAAASASKAKTDGSDSVGGLKVESSVPGVAASIAGQSIQDGVSDTQMLDHDKTMDLDRDLQDIGEGMVDKL